MKPLVVVPNEWVAEYCAFEYVAGYEAAPDAINPVTIHTDTQEYDEIRSDAWAAGFAAGEKARRGRIA